MFRHLQTMATLSSLAVVLVTTNGCEQKQSPAAGEEAPAKPLQSPVTTLEREEEEALKTSYRAATQEEISIQNAHQVADELEKILKKEASQP